MLLSEKLPRVLVVDTHPAEVSRLTWGLPHDRFDLTQARSVDEACRLISCDGYDLALVDLDCMGGSDSLHGLRRLRATSPRTRVLVMSDWGDEQLWLDALDAGACDLVTRPVREQEVRRHL